MRPLCVPGLELSVSTSYFLQLRLPESDIGSGAPGQGAPAPLRYYNNHHLNLTFIHYTYTRLFLLVETLVLDTLGGEFTQCSCWPHYLFELPLVQDWDGFC